MKRLVFATMSLILLVIASSLVVGQQPFTATGVFAEALVSANLRASPSTDAEIVGEILNGTRYPVVGRSEFYPWLLLGDLDTAQPIGWVFADLVTAHGQVNSVQITTHVVDPNRVAVPTPTPTVDAAVPNNNTAPQGETAGSPAPTATDAPTFTVSGMTQGEVNIRYKPDPNSDRLGVARSGDVFEIVGYHTQFPWVQVVYENSPNGYAWILLELLEVTGNVSSTRAISSPNFDHLPTLTPTSAVLGQSSVIRDSEPVEVSAEFEALGNTLWELVLNAGFDPATSRFGALYVRDLQTGEELMFGNDIAFSGTSINKIAILAELFAVLDADPDPLLSTDIANMMICSENVATNRVMGIVGNNDQYAGADEITAFFRELGLQRTFLTAPYDLLGATPIPPTRPIQYPQTTANQTKANPNVTNQMTVDEMGHLMSSIYECAFEESGPLIENFSQGTFTPQECRKMVHVMSNNNVDALLKAGVPEDVTVAHKHGWVADTHGNAALFLTPGGDYVIVAMMHQPSWLNYAESLPVIAEISRLVYNWYNPDTPLDEVREGFIPDSNSCQYRGSPLVQNLADPFFAEELPAFTGDIASLDGY